MTQKGMNKYIPYEQQLKEIWSSYAAAAARSHQSLPILCDPTNGSEPGSPVPGILQARTLEWVAISFSCAWRTPENSWLHGTLSNKRPSKSLHTYTETNHHPKTNKFQSKTYHANSPATQEHSPDRQLTGCPRSHLTHGPISKLITGHSIAHQREEIQFHAPEHRRKLP